MRRVLAVVCSAQTNTRMDDRKKQRFGRYEILAELGRGEWGSYFFFFFFFFFFLSLFLLSPSFFLSVSLRSSSPDCVAALPGPLGGFSARFCAPRAGAPSFWCLSALLVRPFGALRSLRCVASRPRLARAPGLVLLLARARSPLRAAVALASGAARRGWPFVPVFVPGSAAPLPSCGLASGARGVHLLEDAGLISGLCSPSRFCLAIRARRRYRSVALRSHWLCRGGASLRPSTWHGPRFTESQTWQGRVISRARSSC